MPIAIRDLVEMELGKGNFKVVDRTNQEAMFQELALAVNMGSGSVASKFKKFKQTPPQWLVGFDIIDVQATSTGFRYLDKIMAGAAGSMFASLNGAQEQREWATTLRYRVYDAMTGDVLHEGQFSDKTTVFREIQGFMGFDQAQAGGVQMLRSVQSLIQLAVKDIDEKYKLPAMAQAGETKGKRSKSAAKAGPDKAGKMSATRETPQAEPRAACAPANLAGLACQMPVDWKAGSIPSLRDVALKKAPNIRHVENRDKPNEKNTLAESIMKSVAGPVVTLTAPDGPFSAASGVALAAPGLEGRVFRLQGVSGKVSVQDVQRLLEKHFSHATLIEGLAVETVNAKAGPQPILVYKYIEVEHHKEEEGTTDGPASRSASNTKITSLPYYHNMAVSILPKGNDLIVAFIVVREESFIPQLEGFKQMAASFGS